MDLVRSIGILGIVAGHIWLYPNVFFTWHVPVFFVLTGYLWRDRRPFRDELRARVRSLLVPYLTWLAMVAVLWEAYIRWSDWERARVGLRELVLGGWYLKSPYSAYWFLTTLLLAALFTRLAGRLGRGGPWAVGLIGLALSAADAKELREVALGAGTALIGVFFIASGTLLRDVRRHVPHPALVGALVLVPTFLIGYERVVAPVDLKAAITGTPFLSPLLSVAISWSLILLAEGVARAVPRWGGRAVVAFARDGLAVILGHSLVLAVAVREGMDRDGFLLMLSVAIPLAFAALVRRKPLSTLFLGRS